MLFTNKFKLNAQLLSHWESDALSVADSNYFLEFFLRLNFFFWFFFFNNQPTERFKESDWTERIRGLDTKTKSKCKKQDEKQNKII